MRAGIDVTFRYRVGTVEGVLDGTTVSLHEPREFRTLAAAEGYQRDLADVTDRPTLLQVGVLQWTTPAIAEALVAEAVAEGANLR